MGTNAISSNSVSAAARYAASRAMRLGDAAANLARDSSTRDWRTAVDAIALAPSYTLRQAPGARASQLTITMPFA